ncbi:Heavy metal transport/detoxification superfamily protein [Abeliophyllum distichum]|uniref:Heavy metal transport/detoxification superfamily protein n=1 Tax=Abeliophyllum distichum TaxID=126358 RepID=A0ABD1PT28_9LAMI
MAEKKTVMVLKVDLQCPCCYKKIKKILCQIPQITDRTFDEKSNTVIITVICCSPEKIRDKLCRKGTKVIQSIEIKEPPKPKAPEKPKEPQKPKEPEKPKVVVVEKPKQPEKPKDHGPPKEAPKPKDHGPPPAEKPKETPKPAPGPGHVPVGFPPVYPVSSCCGPCYEGYGGGPCYHGYGVSQPPPQPCYDGYSAYGYGRPCHVTRCDYFSEENSAGCRIM